ncbi:MAG TPA: hypothetical protein VFE42_19130 [Chloroflexota bacterium]|nr:hypothetical protein [Chloroflexota bacterium]
MATQPPARHHRRTWDWWLWVTARWNRTPGYLKWLGGLLLGALVRWVFARLFPESWDRLSHQLFDPTMPIWLAVVAMAAILAAERVIPALFRRRAARTGQMRLRPCFGVRWATPPYVERVQGPYCTACTTRLRGTLWSGDASPTLWTCPTCGREFSTPEFPDIVREVERQLRRGD